VHVDGPALLTNRHAVRGASGRVKTQAVGRTFGERLPTFSVADRRAETFIGRGPQVYRVPGIVPHLAASCLPSKSNR